MIGNHVMPAALWLPPVHHTASYIHKLFNKNVKKCAFRNHSMNEQYLVDVRDINKHII